MDSPEDLELEVQILLALNPKLERAQAEFLAANSLSYPHGNKEHLPEDEQGIPCGPNEALEEDED